MGLDASFIDQVLLSDNLLVSCVIYILKQHKDTIKYGLIEALLYGEKYWTIRYDKKVDQKDVKWLCKMMSCLPCCRSR
jgi:hypothetical protein